MLRALTLTARQSLRCAASSSSAAVASLPRRGIASLRGHRPLPARPQAARLTLRPQRRPLSFFDDLKKSFQEEMSKNKDLKDATEKVQEQFAKAAKSTDKEAARQAEAARKAAEMSRKAARKATAESQEKFKAAAEGTTKQAEEAKRRVQEMSEKAAKKAEQLREKVTGQMGFLSSFRDSAAKRAKEVKDRAAQALQEDLDALKSSEEFKNISKEVGDATSKVKGSVSKAKAKVSSTQAVADEKSLLNVVRRSAKEALGETSWTDEFKALFKPEKKIKKIKLAGVAGQEMKDQQKAAQQDAADAAAAEYDGPTGLMNVAQPQTGWQAFAERLGSTPLISRLLEQSKEANKKFGETGTGQAVKGAVNTTKDLRDELRERWETSQNPWVYRLSGWHDTFFAETETSQAIREVQRLDPDFEIEEFLQALQAETIPQVIQSFVDGNNDQLRHVLSEGAYAMTYAAMKARVAEGHVMDPNILHFEEPTLLLAQVMDKMPPVFLVRSVAHQVNCIRNKAGEVTEGSPSEIRTVIYMMAFQQEIDDDLHELTWKIVEFGVHPLEARFI